MALNQLMHPRNPFKTKKPDFHQLAEKYEAFREQTTQDAKGKVHIDFKNPACLKALTWALLKDEYNVDVEIPTDRLIPTIPLRVNYILWLEDIFPEKFPLRGIDIGAGAVCVYPIIGATKNKWSFLATEADATNFEYAKRNVQKNNLCDKIEVVKVPESSSLLDILQDSHDEYDFCMCNPPFYGSNLEAWGVLTSRSSDRPEPSSTNTASPMECIAPGGEVEFVRENIILSSLILKNRIRVYTSMLGKKSSLSKVKEILRENKITNFGSSEFCQGNTMRWGIAWSFDETVCFPKSTSKTMKQEKPRPPLVFNLPSMFNACTLADVALRVERLLLELKVSVAENPETDCSTTSSKCWVATAFENTWSHQRRERRRMAREQFQTTPTADGCESEQTSTRKRAFGEEDQPPAKRSKTDDNGVGSQNQNDSVTRDGQELKKENHSHENAGSLSESVVCCLKENPVDLSRSSCESVLRQTETLPSDSTETSTTRDEAAITRGLPLVKCLVTVRRADAGTEIQLDWIAGQNRECMHQLMQCFKNKMH